MCKIPQFNLWTSHMQMTKEEHASSKYAEEVHEREVKCTSKVFNQSWLVKDL
jgi:hypothetical protein